MNIPVFLGACLLALGTALQAQPSPGQPASPKAERRFDCSRAKDPKACEARLAKAREARARARTACEKAAPGERRDCMRREMCAQSADPAKCEAQAKARAERRAQLREACKGKSGEELRSCYREQRRRL